LGAKDALKGPFHWLHTRFDNQPDMVEFEWVELTSQSCVAKKDGESENEIFVIRQRMEQMWPRWWFAEETDMLHTIR